MSANATDWVTDVQVELVGADSALIARMVARTISEFYRRSGSYVKDFSKDTVSTKRTYTFGSAGETIHFFFSVKVNGFDVFPLVTPFQASGWLYETPTPGTIKLLFDPKDQEDGIAVRVAVIPLKCNAELPEELRSIWYETILRGTLGNMMLMRNRPWSDAKTALIHLRTFADGIAQAVDVTQRQYAVCDRPVQYNKWAK